VWRHGPLVISASLVIDCEQLIYCHFAYAPADDCQSLFPALFNPDFPLKNLPFQAIGI
jgi:hypothetical protein